MKDTEQYVEAKALMIVDALDVAIDREFRKPKIILKGKSFNINSKSECRWSGEC